jgi:hypothetical protein
MKALAALLIFCFAMAPIASSAQLADTPVSADARAADGSRPSTTGDVEAPRDRLESSDTDDAAALPRTDTRSQAIFGVRPFTAVMLVSALVLIGAVLFVLIARSQEATDPDRTRDIYSRRQR